MPKRFFFRGFYSRALLLCIIIIITVSLSLSFFVSSFATKNEKDNYLKKYDIAINNLHRSYYTIQRRFHNVLAPIFNSPAQYGQLCDLLLTDNDPALPIKANSDVVFSLAEVCERDFGARSVLLHSKVTGDLYQFDPRYNTISIMPTPVDFPEFDPFLPGAICQQSLTNLQAGITEQSMPVFGVVGTISQNTSNESIVLGQIIVLYTVSEFISSLEEHALDEGYIIEILNHKGEIIFNSKGDYTHTVTLESMTNPSPATVASAHSVVTLDNRRFYESDLYNTRYNYSVRYLAPVPQYKVQGLIFLLAISICLFSIGVYGVSLRKTDTKVRLIQKGMERVCQNDLTTHISEIEGHDEFAEIIRDFNTMVDKLRQNVDQMYIMELQQKKAELYAMQTSINPHFLYNTLELIRLQAVNGDSGSASRMILLLSKIYRGQIKQRMYVTLSEELDVCENLVSLYQFRFENFEYEFDIPSELMGYGIPKNTLQPLIENYFVHGLVPESEDNLLYITGELFEDSVRGKMLRISVEDNGKPIETEVLNELNNRLAGTTFLSEGDQGFALTNVNSRLRIAFGEGCGLTLVQCETGFKIDILIRPFLTEELNQSLT